MFDSSKVRRPQNLKKISHFFWCLLSNVKTSGMFFQFLGSFLKTWTYCSCEKVKILNIDENSMDGQDVVKTHYCVTALALSPWGQIFREHVLLQIITLHNEATFALNGLHSWTLVAQRVSHWDRRLPSRPQTRGVSVGPSIYYVSIYLEFF